MNNRPGSAFTRLSYPNGQSSSGSSNGNSEFPRQFSHNNSRYPRQPGSSSAGIDGDWRDPRNRMSQEDIRPFAPQHPDHPIFNCPPTNRQYLPNHFAMTPSPPMATRPFFAMANPPLPHLAMTIPPPPIVRASPEEALYIPPHARRQQAQNRPFAPRQLPQHRPQQAQNQPLAPSPSPQLQRQQAQNQPLAPPPPPHPRRQPVQNQPLAHPPPPLSRRQPVQNQPLAPSPSPQLQLQQDKNRPKSPPLRLSIRELPAFFEDRDWDMESEMCLKEATRKIWMLNEFADEKKAYEQKRIIFIREVLRIRWSLSYAGVMGYQLEKEKLFPITDNLGQHANRGEGLEEFVSNRPHFFEERGGKLINRPQWFSKFVIWSVIFIMEHTARGSVFISMRKLIDDFFPFLPLLTPDIPNSSRSDDLITIRLDSYQGKNEARQLYQSLPSIFEYDENEDSIRVRNSATGIPSLLSDFCVQKKFELGILVDRSRIMNFAGVFENPNCLQKRNKNNKRDTFRIKITEGIYTGNFALVSVPATDEENMEAIDDLAEKLEDYMKLRKKLMIHTTEGRAEDFTINGLMAPAYDSERKFQFVVESMVISGNSIPVLVGNNTGDIEIKNLITGPDRRRDQRMSELLRNHRAEHEKRELSGKVKKEQQLITELEKIMIDDGISIKDILALDIKDLPKRTKQLIDYCERRGHLYVIERGEEEDMDNYIVKKQSDYKHKIYMALAEMMCSAPNSWTRQKLQKSILDGRGGELLKAVCQPNDKEPDVLKLDSYLKGTNMMVIKDIHTFKLLYIQGGH